MDKEMFATEVMSYTPQYEDLERLYATYQAQGFIVLDLHRLW